MKLAESKEGKLVYIGKHGEESIDMIHCEDSIEELRGDVANIYLVAEECTNFARTHLVTDFSEDEALQQVAEYLSEKEGEDEPHLIGVFEIVL